MGPISFDRSTAFAILYICANVGLNKSPTGFQNAPIFTKFVVVLSNHNSWAFIETIVQFGQVDFTIYNFRVIFYPNPFFFLFIILDLKFNESVESCKTVTISILNICLNLLNLKDKTETILNKVIVTLQKKKFNKVLPNSLSLLISNNHNSNFVIFHWVQTV